MGSNNSKKNENDGSKADDNRYQKINEINQIEEWTKMKVGNIIFDSDIDNWKIDDSLIVKIATNKFNLIFLIVDDNGNTFGCYINSTIEITNWINDPNAFIFLINSNGRLNGMKKFKCKDSKRAFYLSHSTEAILLSMGYGEIFIRKEDERGYVFYGQHLINFTQGKNMFTNDSSFTLERIVVFQMI